MELATLLRRCRDGNELAWEALVRQYQSRVFGLALHYVGNAEEARDVAQEIFIRVFQNLRRCPDETRFLPWLLRISRNASIEPRLRRQARPPARDLPAEEAHALAAPAPDPEQSWHAKARAQLLNLGLQALSELNREILLLREIQGLSVEETARILDVPAGTVKSRSNRARLELARRLLALTDNRYGKDET